MTDNRFWNGFVPLLSAGLTVTTALVPLTPALIARAVLLNGSAGVAYGWPFWRHSREAAVTAHAVGPIRLSTVAWIAETVLLTDKVRRRLPLRTFWR